MQEALILLTYLFLFSLNKSESPCEVSKVEIFTLLFLLVPRTKPGMEQSANKYLLKEYNNK